jgi:hypothetical protein
MLAKVFIALTVAGLGTAGPYSGDLYGVQTTKKYSTYFEFTDKNSSGLTYGTNGTQSPAISCTVYNSDAPCNVTAANNNYTALVADVLDAHN